MSLNNIANKLSIYLNDAYITLKNRGALIPAQKTLSNISSCINSVITKGPAIVPPEGESLLEIVVSKLPNKIIYNEGDTLDPDGLEIIARYSNNINIVVTENCVLQVNSKLTTQDKQVKVYYKGFETYFSIHVYGAAIPIPQGTMYLYHFNGNTNNEIEGYTAATFNSNYFSYVDGKLFNKCILVGGDRNYVPMQIPYQNNALPSSRDLTNGASITIEFWMKPTWGSSNTEYEIFYLGNTWTSSLSLFFDANYQFKLASGQSSYIITDAGSKYLNQWNHIAVVCKDSKYKLFINGEKIGEKTLSANNSMNTLACFGMGGYYDEFLISSEALYEDDFIPPTGHYGPKKTLEKLVIEQQPTKTIYKNGEIFDLSGAIIKAVFTDGIIEDVTNSCIVQETAPITTSDTYRTVTYTFDGVIKKVYITIGAFLEDPELDIPSEYLERILLINYLESSGEQYIDTGVTVDSTNMTVEIDGMFLNSEGYYIAGAYDGSHYYGLRPDPTATNLLAWHPGISAVNGISYDYLGKRLTYKFKNGNLYINDELVQEGEGAVLTKTLTLFARNGKSAIDAFANCRIYSCKIYKAGELVRNLYPCRYENTGKLGYYDIVNDIVYPNKGTGEFIWG